jgi:hypothetical protein
MGRYNRASALNRAMLKARFRERARPCEPLRGKMKILMLSPTPVAGVPYLLKDIINKYSEHECRTLTGHPGYGDGRLWARPDVNWSQVREAQKLVSWADVIMLHNGARHPRTAQLAHFFTRKRLLSYYHSEPHRVDRKWERAGVTAYVIAQGHSLLYPGLGVLPNLVDIHHPLMKPPADRPAGKKFVLAYSPSNKHPHSKMVAQNLPFSSKGYPEVQPALRKLAARKDITISEFTGVPFEKCMAKRKMCHLILDEVVTGSYHRCSLEACSHAQLAINFLHRDVEAIVQRVTGCHSTPWLRSSADSLYEVVAGAVENPRGTMEMMKEARAWMEKYWDPKALLERFYIPAFRMARIWG